MTTVHKGSSRNNWSTPQELFDRLDAEFGFTLDVCASAENAKCERYYTIEDDALQQPWAPHVCWMNPPYSLNGRGIVGDWLQKAYEESQQGATVVALVVNDPSTKWWADWAYKAAEIRFLIGPRLKFDGRGGCPFTSVVLVYRPHHTGNGQAWFWDWRRNVRK